MKSEKQFSSHVTMQGKQKRMYRAFYNSPLGRLIMVSDGISLTGLWFEGMLHTAFPGEISDVVENFLPIFSLAAKWLDVYFSGKDPGFLPPLSFESTLFRESVWNEVLKVPYGQTVSYGQLSEIIAKQRGRERMSSQAIGGALAHNPILLMIPCHRVIGAFGCLTGYAGGLERKAGLLSCESDHAARKG